MAKYFLLFLTALIFYSCKSSSNLLKQREANEYVSLPNKIGDVSITEDNGENDLLYFEDIKYKYEDHNHLFVLGNLMGGRTSLLVALQKHPLQLLYTEESAYCDSIRIKELKGNKFIIANSHYTDMCTEECYFSVYLIRDGIYKCFEDLSKEKFRDGGDFCLPKGNSYEQFFKMGIKDNKVVIFANKVEDNKNNQSFVYTFESDSIMNSYHFSK